MQDDPLLPILKEFYDESQGYTDEDLLGYVKKIRETVADPIGNYLGDDFRIAERIVLNGR